MLTYNHHTRLEAQLDGNDGMVRTQIWCLYVTNLVEKIKYICGEVFLIYPLMAQRQSHCGIVVGTMYILAEPLQLVCTLQLFGEVSWRWMGRKNSFHYGGYAYDSDLSCQKLCLRHSQRGDDLEDFYVPPPTRINTFRAISWSCIGSWFKRTQGAANKTHIYLMWATLDHPISALTHLSVWQNNVHVYCD